MATVNQSPGVSTFDASPPRRPGVADFNGCAKVDDSKDPPDPQTMPNAPEWQTTQLTLIAVAKMTPQVSVSVKQTGGTYSIDLVTASSSSIGVTNVFLTKIGTGDVAVHVDASLLAPETLRPCACSNQGASVTLEAVDYFGTDPNTSVATRGAEVKMQVSGTLTDGAFTVHIY